MSAELETRVQERTAELALSNEKLRSIGIDMPTWQDALRRYLATLG